MKKIAIHIGLIILSSIFLITIVLWILKFYTQHDSVLIEVPDLKKKTSIKAISELQALGLEAEIVDTVYKEGAKKYEVINQNPPAALKVKNGRKVYLVINTGEVPMVEVPALAGRTSLSQALNILSRAGLKLGRVIKSPSEFVHSEADEPVLGQMAHNETEELRPGAMIERNSMIDIVVGIPVNTADSLDADIELPTGENEPIELF